MLHHRSGETHIERRHTMDTETRHKVPASGPMCSLSATVVCYNAGDEAVGEGIDQVIEPYVVRHERSVFDSTIFCSS